MTKKIDLNDYKKNIYQKSGYKECPHYSEDGVILKIFDMIKPNSKPLIVEFGEHRVLGTTTRSFRIKYFSKSIYFAGNYDLYSSYLNFLDIIKISIFEKSFRYIKFLFNFPFKFFVTPDNIVDLLSKKKAKKIDILCIDIDSYDYFIAKKILESEINVKLFIIEYNPNLPNEKMLTMPYPEKKRMKKNGRIFGANFLALENLFNKFDYNLIHIAGFCNLYFVKKENADNFKKTNYRNEIPNTNEKIQDYSRKYCMKDFLPSWFKEDYLTNEDLIDFIEIK